MAAMARPSIEDLKSEICFEERDAANVRALGAEIGPQIESIIDRFYEILLRDPKVRETLDGGEAQMARVRVALRCWLEEVLRGIYDGVYMESRLRVGRTHVEVELPQRYMVIGMQIIWAEIESRARRLGIEDLSDKLASLHKLLLLDLSIMLESYHERFAVKVRAAERAAVQAKLARAEQLAEVGQLSASLAHEIKNPLAGISGAIQIIGDAMADDDPHRQVIRDILVQVHRLDEAVKDLLIYASPVPPRPTDSDVDKMVRHVLAVLSEEPTMRRIRIDYTPVVGMPSLRFDPGQMEQLLMNLLLNSADASPDGGRVGVSIDVDTDHLTLAVSDQGSGIPDEVLAKIFEPFFTTKAKGTGLGLTICRKIATAHGGSIDVKSRLGVGTTVTVKLPLGERGAVGEES